MLDKTPSYNLKAVLKETGLTAAALRAWERRYGLPRPARTRGGHRLYSAYDVATVRWLKARISEGLSVSRAVDLWRQVVAAGRDPLAELERPAPPPASLEAARQAWVEACLALDERRAEEILNQAFSLHSVERVCLDLLAEGLAQIGDSWSKGFATVQHEHFASQLATRRIDALLVACPEPVRPATVLVACPPGEWHAFPLHLISLLLRRRGWRVIYLGANVPLDRALETVRFTHPGLVLLASQHLVSAARLREMADVLSRAGFVVAYGGRAPNLMPRMRALVAAHFAGETIEAAIEQAESLLASGRPAPPAEEIPPEAAELARHFRQRRAHLESVLTEHLQAPGLSISLLETANEFLGDMMAAALEFGSPEFLSADLTCVVDSLSGAGIDRQALPAYLRSYAECSRRVLGEAIDRASACLEQMADALEATARLGTA